MGGRAGGDEKYESQARCCCNMHSSFKACVLQQVQPGGSAECEIDTLNFGQALSYSAVSRSKCGVKDARNSALTGQLNLGVAASGTWQAKAVPLSLVAVSDPDVCRSAHCAVPVQACA